MVLSAAEAETIGIFPKFTISYPYYNNFSDIKTSTISYPHQTIQLYSKRSHPQQHQSKTFQIMGHEILLVERPYGPATV